MRIVQVCKYFYPRVTGVTSYVHDLSRALMRRGHDVTVLTWDAGVRFSAGQESLCPWRQEEMDGLPLVRVPAGDTRALAAALVALAGGGPGGTHLPEACGKKGSDVPHPVSQRPLVVNTHGIWEHVPVVAAVARQRHIPLVVTMHGTWMFLQDTAAYRTWRSRLRFAAYRRFGWPRIMRQAAACVVLNAPEQSMAEAWGVSLERIHRIPNAVDVGRFPVVGKAFDEVPDLPPRGEAMDDGGERGGMSRAPVWPTGPRCVTARFSRSFGVPGDSPNTPLGTLSGDAHEMSGGRIGYPSSGSGENAVSGGIVSPVRILFVGAVQRQKGLFTLLEAADICRRNGVPAVWRICGTGPDMDAARALCRERELDDVVVFAGPVPRESMPDEYAMADVVALPSRAEPFGTVFLEAMASGKPCIGSDCGGTPEIITNGQTGLLVPFGNAGELARAVEVLACDAALRNRMGVAARERAERYFDWSGVSGQLEAVYAGVAR